MNFANNKIGERQESLKCFCGDDHPTHANRSLQKRTVAFLHDYACRNWGSTVLRSKQLAEFLGEFDPGITVWYGSIQEYTGTKPDAIILSKTALSLNQSYDTMLDFARGGTKIMVDLVDGDPTLAKRGEQVVDAYICASLSEFEFRTNQDQEAFFVAHHVDSRIPTIDPAEGNQFRVGYAGRIDNAQWLEVLPISVHDVDTSDFSIGTQELVRFLRGITHHYSIRRHQPWDGFKPGTKPFLAAHFGSVFIGSLADRESMLLLGHEYPYLSKSSNLEDVTEIISLAKRTFQSQLHSSALDRMHYLRKLSCRAKVSLDLHSAISRVLGA